MSTSMRKSVLLQVRIPERVMKDLNKLIEAGIFKSRSEAVTESLRRLLLEYSTLLNEESFTVEMYLSGKLERDLSPNDAIEINVKEAKENLANFFGTTDVDITLRRIRSERV